MTADLSSRAIVGEFYKTLEEGAKAGWYSRIGMLFDSNQEAEEYKWLGATPAMREFVGGRNAKGLRTTGLTLRNKLFEASLYVSVDDLRRDKTGQILVRIREMADRANQHWNRLLSDLIAAGETTPGYDGANFFSTTHNEGKSGNQSNLVTFDISDAGLSGVPVAATPDIIQRAILSGVQAIMGFVDDQGEPMNEGASSFAVMVPPSYMASAAAAIALPTLSAGAANVIPALAGSEGLRFNLVTNPRLSSWTTSLAVFRDDGRVKPFILQQETAPEMIAVAEGSEMERIERRHFYGVETNRNAGYGMWQHAAKVNIQG